MRAESNVIGRNLQHGSKLVTLFVGEPSAYVEIGRVSVIEENKSEYWREKKCSAAKENLEEACRHKHLKTNWGYLGASIKYAIAIIVKHIAPELHVLAIWKTAKGEKVGKNPSGSEESNENIIQLARQLKSAAGKGGKLYREEENR